MFVEWKQVWTVEIAFSSSIIIDWMCLSCCRKYSGIFTFDVSSIVKHTVTDILSFFPFRNNNKYILFIFFCSSLLNLIWCIPRKLDKFAWNWSHSDRILFSFTDHSFVHSIIHYWFGYFLFVFFYTEYWIRNLNTQNFRGFCFHKYFMRMKPHKCTHFTLLPIIIQWPRVAITHFGDISKFTPFPF